MKASKTSKKANNHIGDINYEKPSTNLYEPYSSNRSYRINPILSIRKENSKKATSFTWRKENQLRIKLYLNHKT